MPKSSPKLIGEGDKHERAKDKMAGLLNRFYHFVRVEYIFPVPNPKYLYDQKNVKPFIPFKLDVYAEDIRPKNQDYEVVHDIIGVELDGDIGHKKSGAQSFDDEMRTQAMKAYDNRFPVFRIDVDDVIGKGYVNPKTKKRNKTSEEMTHNEDLLLEELGIYKKESEHIK